jgi:hypothetical protein
MFQYIFPLMKKLYENFNALMELSHQSKMCRLSLGEFIALLMLIAHITSIIAQHIALLT